MPNPTRINPFSNELSEKIKKSSDTIKEVIPRDTSMLTERYIIFLEDGKSQIPPETKKVIETHGFELRDIENHAMKYENKETGERADYIALNKK